VRGTTSTFEGDRLLRGLRRVETQELGKFATVLGILVDTKLDVLAKGLIELLGVIFVLSNLREQIHALLDDVLANDLEDLVLLKSLTRDVERQVLRIDDTLDKVEVLRNEVLTIIHNEDTADVEFDVVALLLALKQIKRRAKGYSETTSMQTNEGGVPLRDIKDGFEFKLTFDGEVLDSKVVLPVVSKRLVKGAILLLCDVARVTCPDRLRLIELLVDFGLLLDLLFLLFLGLILIFVLDLLNLGLALVVLILFLFNLFFLILDLLQCVIRDNRRTAVRI